MESRILAISTHALIESVVNYGLAVSGRHVCQRIMDEVDTGVLNVAARKILVANASASGEVLYALSVARNTFNYYISKTANVPDRTLRSANAGAQENAWNLAQSAYEKTKKQQGDNFFRQRRLCCSNLGGLTERASGGGRKDASTANGRSPLTDGHVPLVSLSSPVFSGLILTPQKR